MSSFLNARVLDQSLLQLFQTLLEIRTERQRFCDFHRAFPFYRDQFSRGELECQATPQKEKATLISERGLYLMPATTYSPTHFRVQYHRPSGA